MRGYETSTKSVLYIKTNKMILYHEKTNLEEIYPSLELAT